MRRAFFQLHISVFLAGFTAILGKLISLNEGILTWYRPLFTAATLWLMYMVGKSKPSVTRADRLRIIGIGGIVALHWVTFYGSIKFANVSVALVCFSSIGFFTAVFEPLMLRTQFRTVELFLGLLTMAGIAIIFHFDHQYKEGIIIGIISAFLSSIFTILNRTVLKRNSAATVTLYELTGGFFLLTLMPPFYLQFSPASAFVPSLPDLFWLLILSWFCTVLAFNLSMLALEKISAFTVNLSFNLEPVYGILLAFIIFKENQFLGSGFYIGLTIIILSVVIQTLLVYRSRKKIDKASFIAGS